MQLQDVQEVYLDDLRNRAQLFEGRLPLNPMLNFNLGLFIPLFKSLFGIISCLIFRASNNNILDKKNSTEFSFKAIRSEIRFHTNPELS